MIDSHASAAHHAYLFEAKGIQRYIFASGKLRDVVGASDLVASLASGADDDLDEIGTLLTDTLKWPPSVQRFSRRAGGAFCLHAAERSRLVEVRAHWRMWVMFNLPGLEFVDGLGAGDSDLAAREDCFAQLDGGRVNAVAEVRPLGRPISLIAPLTGRPSLARRTYGEDVVLLDAITLPQRDRSDPQRKASGKDKPDRVAKRFIANAEERVFPRDFDARESEASALPRAIFPFRNDGAARAHLPQDKRIALIHADLSGLGEMFRNMGKSFAGAADGAQQNLMLARRIEEAIIAASRETSAAILDIGGHVLPARPVLLGGDDITIIVRADLAIQFTVALLEAIETRCAPIGGAEGQAALSACAGVAIVNAGSPFLTAHHLADDLCSHAKTWVKDRGRPQVDGREGYASAFSFHVRQQTAIESYGSDIASAKVDADGRTLSLNPYLVGKRAGAFPGEARRNATRLLRVARALASVEAGAGRVRELQSLLCDDVVRADATWRRWWQWDKRRHGDAASDGMKGLAEALSLEAATYQGTAIPGLPRGDSGLFDALLLLDLGAVEAPPSGQQAEPAS